MILEVETFFMVTTLSLPDKSEKFLVQIGTNIYVTSKLCFVTKTCLNLHVSGYTKVWLPCWFPNKYHSEFYSIHFFFKKSILWGIFFRLFSGGIIEIYSTLHSNDTELNGNVLLQKMCVTPENCSSFVHLILFKCVTLSIPVQM